MATKTIIKGALYFDGDMILRPHYSGEFWMVDCTEYKTKEQIQEEYDEENQTEFLEGSCIENEGIKYFLCEYGPHQTENLELLTDISEIDFFDEETYFK